MTPEDMEVIDSISERQLKIVRKQEERELYFRIAPSFIYADFDRGEPRFHASACDLALYAILTSAENFEKEGE